MTTVEDTPVPGQRGDTDTGMETVTDTDQETVTMVDTGTVTGTEVVTVIDTGMVTDITRTGTEEMSHHGVIEAPDILIEKTIVIGNRENNLTQVIKNNDKRIF